MTFCCCDWIMKLFSKPTVGSGPRHDSNVCLPGEINVLLYDKPDDIFHMKGRYKIYEATRTCEAVCRDIAVELGITPTWLHCFGLTVYDRSSKSQNSHTWLAPLQKLEEAELGSVNREIHFRLRYLPDKERLKHLLQFDKECFDYCIAQVTWDFLMDCMPGFDARKNEEIARGISCPLIMYKIKQHEEIQLTDNDNFNNIFNDRFNSFLPSSLHKTCWQGSGILKSSIKDRLKELRVSHRRYDSPELKQWFLGCVLAEIKNLYQEERFIAYHVEIEEEFESVDEEPPVPSQIEQLHITVNFGHNKPQLCIVKQNGEEYFRNEIVNLNGLDVEKTEVNGRPWWRVQIHRLDGHPREIYFDDKMTAYSFLTGLESFYRCVFDYYKTLCKDVSHSEVEMTRVHGPVSDEYIKRILKKRNSPDVYILRTDPKLYGQYDVFYLPSRDESMLSAILPKIIQTDGGYIVEGSTDAPVDVKTLVNRLVQNADILPESVKHFAQRLNPTKTGCDLLTDILFEEFDSQLDEGDKGNELARKRQDNQPKVFMGSDVEKMSFIGSGYFTETHYGMLQEKDIIVIKQMRTDRILDADFRVIYQELQEGFQKLMCLYDPKFFVTYYGVCLTSTPIMLIGGSRGNHGSLSHFLQYRQPSPVLSLHHLVEVCEHLASAIEYMVKIDCFHGNLHCDNLTVMTFDEWDLIVKITDPGMVSLYNKLPMDHVINKARLPWLAPEVYNNLSILNVHTEVYSYSTTLWQMFSNGRSPLHHDPKIVSLNPDKIQDFFSQEGNTLSCPDILCVQDSDPDVIKDLKKQLYNIMVECWALNPEERLEPVRIKQKLNYSMEKYGSYYHKYNEIAYFSHDVGMSAPTVTDRGDSSGFHDTRHVAVPDISVLRVTRNQEPLGVSLPNSIILYERAQREDEAPGPSVASGTERARQQQPVGGTPQLNGRSVVSRLGNLPDLPPLPVHIIDDRRLEIGHMIGAGYYGQVHKGKLKSLHDDSKSVVVVKELKKGMREKFLEGFRKEAKVMATLDHPNIVKFHGMSRSEKYLVMEYLPNNSLITYVKKNNSPPFLKLAVDLSAGMAFLEDKKVLHCDLAARNVLLTADLRAKISDFGLSKMLPSQIYYYRRHEEQVIPIPWCSPEVIQVTGKFTVKNDVWSFGVVLWEMYSHGKQPFLCNNVPELLKKLFDGHRLPKPEDCPDTVYDVMNQCWNYNPEQRPSFHTCHQIFQTMLNPSSVPVTSQGSPSRGQTTGSQSVNLSTNQSLQSSLMQPNICIDRSQLNIDQTIVLGKGAFGKVYKGQYNGRDVAIKECTQADQYSRFKREFEILYSLRKEATNIVQFIGICELDKSGLRNHYNYVMEYLPGGSLKSYLIDNKDALTLQQRLQFLIDTAKGMNFLFKKAIVHCDVTASNVLLTSENVAKIADFGWAKQLDNEEENYQYKRDNSIIQFLWAAPEAYQDTYCKFSDIWSYGVLCIEVFKNGEEPALDIPLHAIKKDRDYYRTFAQAVMKGTRYPRPNLCPVDLYEQVLLKCWAMEPRERIVYFDILKILNRKAEECNTEPTSNNF